MLADNATDSIEGRRTCVDFNSESVYWQHSRKTDLCGWGHGGGAWAICSRRPNDLLAPFIDMDLFK